MEPLGRIDGQEVEVNAIEEAVALIPALLLDYPNELVVLRLILLCRFRQMQTITEVDHRGEFLHHKRIQVNIARAAWGPIKDPRVIVHPNAFIGLPEIETRRLMAMILPISGEESLQGRETLTEPG